MVSDPDGNLRYWDGQQWTPHMASQSPTRQPTAGSPVMPVPVAKTPRPQPGFRKTKGCQTLKGRSLIPSPVMTHPDRLRLDQLLVWEEKSIALAEAAWKPWSPPIKRR